MKFRLIPAALLFSAAFPLCSQQSGNQVYGQRYRNHQTDRPEPSGMQYLSDSTFAIGASILTNVMADQYVAVFGVSESAATLKDANAKIDERVRKFIADVSSKLKIPPSDIYVDMTTQTQIADYKVNGQYAEQYLSGFEQKKTVVIKYRNTADLDKMVVLASENGIYDLAKVDYIVEDPGKIYEQLFLLAMEVITKKKDLYVKATGAGLVPASMIYRESFYSMDPSQLYSSYTPNVTSEYSDHNSYSRRKDLRQNTTFYYDHISYAGFDKVLKPVVTEPAVEFVLLLQVKFEIERAKK